MRDLTSIQHSEKLLISIKHHLRVRSTSASRVSLITIRCTMGKCALSQPGSQWRYLSACVLYVESGWAIAKALNREINPFQRDMESFAKASCVVAR